MNERAFRLDFFLALAAVMLSVVTTIALIYQTAVMRDQYAATVWPYLSIDSTYGDTGETLTLMNDGFGPALIRSAQLSVDSKPVKTWNEYIKLLFKDPNLRKNVRRGSSASISTASIDASTIIRAGDPKVVFALKLPGALPTIVKHTITIDFCYCSLNGTCWNLHGTPGRALGYYPQPTHACTVGPTIDSPVGVGIKPA